MVIYLQYLSFRKRLRVKYCKYLESNAENIQIENNVNLFVVWISPKKIQSGPKKTVTKDLKKQG